MREWTVAGTAAAGAVAGTLNGASLYFKWPQGYGDFDADILLYGAWHGCFLGLAVATGFEVLRRFAGRLMLLGYLMAWGFGTLGGMAGALMYNGREGRSCQEFLSNASCWKNWGMSFGGAVAASMALLWIYRLLRRRTELGTWVSGAALAGAAGAFCFWTGVEDRDDRGFAWCLLNVPLGLRPDAWALLSQRLLALWRFPSDCWDLTGLDDVAEIWPTALLHGPCFGTCVALAQWKFGGLARDRALAVRRVPS